MGYSGKDGLFKEESVRNKSFLQSNSITHWRIDLGDALRNTNGRTNSAYWSRNKPSRPSGSTRDIRKQIVPTNRTPKTRGYVDGAADKVSLDTVTANGTDGLRI
jgi:hypothetical protein